MSYGYKNITITQSLTAGPVGHVVTTTKGDLITDNGTQTVRLPVGADGQVVVANAAQSNGLAWQTLTPSNVGLGNVSNNLNNYTAITDPTVNDDSSAGYSVGSVWFNQTTLKEFTLFDATVGAAVWVDTTATNIVAGDGLTQTGTTINVGGSTTIFANTNDVVVNSSATANQVLLSSGTVGTSAVYGAVPLADANAVSGILPITNGGTGVSSYTGANLLIATNATNDGLVASTLDPATVVTLTGTQTLTNKTLVTPDITTSINDANGNEIINLSPTVGAVNDITIANNSTGNAPSITASGTDANVDLAINAQGTGQVVISTNRFPTTNGSAGQVLGTDGAGNLSFVNVQTQSIGTVSTSDATLTTISSLTLPTTTDTGYFVRSVFIGRDRKSVV